MLLKSYFIHFYEPDFLSFNAFNQLKKRGGIACKQYAEKSFYRFNQQKKRERK